MKFIAFLSHSVAFMIWLLMKIIIGLWKGLLVLIDLVDGGDGEMSDDNPQQFTHYNYFTGEIDHVRYPDGIYSDDRIDRGISDP